MSDENRTRSENRTTGEGEGDGARGAVKWHEGCFWRGMPWTLQPHPYPLSALTYKRLLVCDFAEDFVEANARRRRADTVSLSIAQRWWPCTCVGDGMADAQQVRLTCASRARAPRLLSMTEIGERWAPNEIVVGCLQRLEPNCSV
ncbi:MAG: hypothetical protein AAFV29_21045 [Myxococcota bacterium]